MHKIKPRIDDDGVPWCDAGCPAKIDSTSAMDAYEEVFCGIDERWRRIVATVPAICPHAVKLMAVEIEAWRNRTLTKCSMDYGDKWVDMWSIHSAGHTSHFGVIDDAIDALIAEREE